MRKLHEFDWLKTDNFAELSAKLFHYYFHKKYSSLLKYYR
jgi:hypothetical protein